MAAGVFGYGPSRTPCRTSMLTGAAWIQELLSGHPDPIHDHFRMDRNSFLRIAEILIEGNYYEESIKSRVGIHEALGMFLLIVAHKWPHRIVSDRLQHSPETVNRLVVKIGEAFCDLAPRVIRPIERDDCHPKIRYNQMFYPWFKDCLGALDGTFIPAYVPKWQHDAFRTRKATICQNVLAACDHDMRFVHLHCGWEGSANDARVLRHALSDEAVSFPRPRRGEFYLVDSAFTHMPGFMAPFKNQRYHINAWADGGQERTMKELFNHAHSKLRNVVERMFGKWKRCFAFLKGPMNNFHFTHQVNMVISCAVIHNLLIDQLGTEAYIQMCDNIVDEDDDEEHVAEPSNSLPRLRDLVPVDATAPELFEWNNARDGIANAMWAAREL